MHKQEVKYLLPETESWYNYFSKRVAENTGDWVTVALPDLEQAVFVRGGSILPILLHDDCPSILSCISNDVRLEVYPDAQGQAEGTVYLDDGSSYEFQDTDKGSARLNFSYSEKLMTVSYEHGQNYQALPNVASIVIYGVTQAPSRVASFREEGNLEFIYEASTQALYVILSEETSVGHFSIYFDM